MEGTNRRSTSIEGFCFQERRASGRGGFCIKWLAKSTPQSLPLNMFSILVVEESNTSVDKPTDVPLLCDSSQVDSAAKSLRVTKRT